MEFDKDPQLVASPNTQAEQKAYISPLNKTTTMTLQ